MAREQIRIESLDGLRGIAALWVLVGHAMQLTGFHLPLLAQPDLGVDLFIMLSGFLMAFHFTLRREAEPWESPKTWLIFWTRRFFRIAPLYYVCLVLALAAGAYIFEARETISGVVVGRPEPAERFQDLGLTNLALHGSFLFGLTPKYAVRTALPDWSIGLEMQYYLALPFLMWLILRLGWSRGAILLAILSVMTGAVASFVFDFPEPSFLPLKLHVFLAGMLTASVILAPGRQALLCAMAALFLVLVPIGGSHNVFHLLVRVVLVLTFFALVHHRFFAWRDRNAVAAIANMLGNRAFHWLGELSFGVYLMHLVVMQPIIAWLIRHDDGVYRPLPTFLMALGATIALTYGLAAIGHFLIERPGQRLGKKTVGMIRGDRRRLSVAGADLKVQDEAAWNDRIS